MDRQRQSFEPNQDNVVRESTPSGKKVYEVPEVQDWGSITDLTRGIKLGIEDFNLETGTRVA